jgi:hypothetical protein
MLIGLQNLAITCPICHLSTPRNLLNMHDELHPQSRFESNLSNMNNEDHRFCRHLTECLSSSKLSQNSYPHTWSSLWIISQIICENPWTICKVLKLISREPESTQFAMEYPSNCMERPWGTIHPKWLSPNPKDHSVQPSITTQSVHQWPQNVPSVHPEPNPNLLASGMIT